MTDELSWLQDELREERYRVWYRTVFLPDAPLEAFYTDKNGCFPYHPSPYVQAWEFGFVIYVPPHRDTRWVRTLDEWRGDYFEYPWMCWQRERPEHGW